MFAALLLFARVIRITFVTLRIAVSLVILGAGTVRWVKLQRST